MRVQVSDVPNGKRAIGLVAGSTKHEARSAKWLIGLSGLTAGLTFELSGSQFDVPATVKVYFVQIGA